MGFSKLHWGLTIILWFYGNNVFLFSPTYPGKIPKLLGGFLGDLFLVYVGFVFYRTIKTHSTETIS